MIHHLQVKKLNFWQSLIGLIGKDNPEPVLIQTRFGIHTFSLKFPIDVIICDDNHRIKKIKLNLKPNWIFFWNPIYNEVLELPTGWVSKENIKVKDVVELILQ